MYQWGKILIIPALCINVLVACGLQNDGRTEQKTILGNQDLKPPEEFRVREYNQNRAYIYDQSRNLALDIETRLENEAERVYNVAEAAAMRQGKEILLAIATKQDPMEKQEEVAKRVRERLESKEPELAGYNLHIFVDRPLHNQLLRAKSNRENLHTPGYQVNETEPTFDRILQQVKQSNRTY